MNEQLQLQIIQMIAQIGSLSKKYTIKNEQDLSKIVSLLGLEGIATLLQGLQQVLKTRPNDIAAAVEVYDSVIDSVIGSGKGLMAKLGGVLYYINKLNTL